MGAGLVGKTLGIVGLGNTGAETLRVAKPLGMNFIAYDPHPDKRVAEEVGARLVDLDDIFRESDVVIIACWLDESTYHLVNKKRLSLMKPTAYLINSSRGGVVDQNALVDALSEGRIAGAGLDVLEREPPDPDEPIFEFENVVLNPHAISWTDQCLADCFAEAIQATLDVMEGRIPKDIVNRDVLENPAWIRKLESYRKRFAKS